MKKFLYIFLFFTLVLIGLGLYYLIDQGKFTSLTVSGNIWSGFSKGKISGYDIRLFKYYLTTKHTDRDIVINLAKKNCFGFDTFSEVSTSASPSAVPLVSPSYAYQKNLRKDLLLKLNLDENKIAGLIFVYEIVPDSNQCYLIWMIDTKGKGLVGYETKDSKMQLYNSNLPQDKLDNILKNYKFL